jgi:putative intracellular protease/amidase
VVYDGVDELDVFGPFEVLTGAGLEVRLVTAEPREQVATVGGARIAPHGVLGDPDLVIAAVCTGAMILAGTGLLRGRRAITHHDAVDELAAAGADVVSGARFVDDGDIVTAAGVTSGIDLALWLVERELGPDAAGAQAAEIEWGLSRA